MTSRLHIVSLTTMFKKIEVMKTGSPICVITSNKLRKINILALKEYTTYTIIFVFFVNGMCISISP